MSRAYDPYHSPSCSGCPVCSSEMADLFEDSVHNRVYALAHRLNALTERHIRTLTSRSGPPPPLPRPPAPMARVDSVPPPPSLVDAIRQKGRVK